MTSPQDGQPERKKRLVAVRQVPTKAAGLCRKHKNIIHGTIFVSLVVLLYFDGGKPADWMFLVLSLVVEVQ